MKNKIGAGLLGMLFIWCASAQELTEYSDDMNRIFQYVDKSRITTGLLYDYGLQLIDPLYYDGALLTDSNYVDIGIWKTLYSGMYTSKVNNNISLSTPDQMDSKIDSEADNSLVLMHLKFDKYKDNAADVGLVKIQNEQIYDVSGQNPYEQKMLFAVAPKRQYFESNVASFKFNSNLNINNTGKTIRSMQINFNNESGYQTVGWNTPVSYAFSSAGIKDVYFRITYTDNSVYTVRTKIAVSEEVLPSLRSSSETKIAATANHSGGTIQIKYSPTNNTGKIRKPFIVAEGFDPAEVMGGGGLDIHSLYESGKLFGTLNTGSPNLWNRIEYLDYDVVYLNYANGLDDIRRNAKLFQEVIEYVNANKVGGAPNVVLGISMGGLVARYALRKMELENKEHDTWKYISMDSPHKGANIPIGFQAMLRHVADIKVSVLFIPVWRTTSIDLVKKAVKLLDSKAAKQMLVYYVGSSGAINNTEHDSFQTEYDNLGFPVRCENIALTDGSGYGTQEFAPGTTLVDINETHKVHWFLSWISMYLGPTFLRTNFPKFILLSVPGSSQIVATVKVNAVPNRTTAQVYNGKIRVKKKILWIVSASTTITSKSLNSNTSIYPVDGAPGGVYDVITMFNSAPPTF